MLNAVPVMLVGCLLFAVGCQPIVVDAKANPSLSDTTTHTSGNAVHAGVSNVSGGAAGETSIVPTVTTGITATQPISSENSVTGSMSAIDVGSVKSTTSDITLSGDIVMDAGYTPEQVQAGQAIYRQQYCGVCHKLDVIGTRGTFGPPHDTVGALALQRIDDAAYRGEANTAAAYLHESLVQPGIYLVPGYEATAHHMPPYTHLPEEQLQALVAFLLAQQ